MRLVFWLLAMATVGANNARAQDLAFGSETWRGHGFAVPDVPLSCRVFSSFGNGDQVAFVGVATKASTDVLFMAFVFSWDHEAAVVRSQSIAPILDRLPKPPGTVPARLWVDDDTATAVEGTANSRSVGFTIGTLGTSKSAKVFNAIRVGGVLHVAVAGQDRKYVLRGSFSALSELVGCALKARDGEVTPSSGMPKPAVSAVIPSPIPAPVQPVASTPLRPTPPTPSHQLSSTGTGIVVTSDGHILTNNHVIAGCGSFGVRRAGEAERRAILLAHDTQNDLALLKAAQPYADVAILRVEPPRLAEGVLVFGFPLSGILASSGNVTLGNVSAMAGLGDDSREIQITAAIQPGNSGGPVFDGSGLVLGVIRSKLDTVKAASLTGDIAQNVNFAIRGALAVSFLGANGIEPLFERRRASRPPDDVSDHAQKVAIQVLCYKGQP